MCSWPRFSIAVFIWLSLFPSPQQDASPAQAPQESTHPAASPPAVDRRITLDVVVTDKSGNPVPDLQQEDFSLVDDTQLRNILSFSASPGKTNDPVQAIFLVDAVNTSFRGISNVRIELEKFLRQDGGRLPIPMSLVIFTDTATEVQRAPTRDGNALADSLNSKQTGLRSIGRSQGFYGAVERLQMCLRALESLASYEANQPGRKLLVWLSPGWPLLSGPNVDLTAKNQQWLFGKVVEMSKALRDARITLYSIDPLGVSDAASFRTFYYQSFLKGVRSANKVQNGNLALQVLATQSGGRVLNSGNDIAEEIARCVTDSKAFYTLSFDSPPADGPNEYHSLEVKIDKPGLTARTRTGYYAQP